MLIKINFTICNHLCKWQPSATVTYKGKESILYRPSAWLKSVLQGSNKGYRKMSETSGTRLASLFPKLYAANNKKIMKLYCHKNYLKHGLFLSGICHLIFLVSWPWQTEFAESETTDKKAMAYNSSAKKRFSKITLNVSHSKCDLFAWLHPVFCPLTIC